jgi:hypothetical protein
MDSLVNKAKKGVWLMKINRVASYRSLYLSVCMFGAAFAAIAAEPPIITIDAPGAGTGQFQGTGCFAFTDCSVLLNNFGAVTGYYLDANNVYHGFVRSPAGKFTSFQAPGADTTPQDFNGTLPNAINDAGAIAGEYYDVNNEEHGFLRSPEGKFTTFDVPGGTAGSTTPIALNLEGAIVGYYLDQSGGFQGFLRKPDGTFETWTAPGGCVTTPSAGCFGTAAFGINAFGFIAGASEDNKGNFVDRGFIRSPSGRFTTYTVLAAGTGPYQGTGSPGSSAPINVFGAVASYYIDSNNVVHGYLRSPLGEITTYDVPGEGPQGIGCFSDCSIGLNDFGAITGYYLDANNVYHGYVRNSQGKVTSFDAPGADQTAGSFNGTFPVSINDQGAITGYYLDSSNVNHAFLVLPTEW